MDSLSRVLTALRREQPDRVPIVEFVIDPKVAKAAVPGCTSTADCMDKLNMDAVSCGVQFTPVEHRQDGSWTDEWGVAYKPGPEVASHPVSGPINSMNPATAAAGLSRATRLLVTGGRMPSRILTKS